MLQLSLIIHLFQYISLTSLTILLLFNFSPYNYTSYNIFSSILPFYFPTTLYINVTIPSSPPLHLPLNFALLLPFYLLYNLLFSIQSIFGTKKKKKVNILSFSLTLKFCYSLLYIYFRLANFCVDHYFR